MRSIAPARSRRRTSTICSRWARSAIKIPTQYGGLGLSQVNYGRAAMLLGSWDANLTALVSAHQSIGVPQPLLAFRNGRAEEKISAARRAQGNLRVRADGMERRLRSGEHESAGRSDGRRLGLHPERRKTLVHESDQSRRARGHGEDTRRKS